MQVGEGCVFRCMSILSCSFLRRFYMFRRRFDMLQLAVSVVCSVCLGVKLRFVLRCQVHVFDSRCRF